MDLELVVRGGGLDGRVFVLAENQMLTVGRAAGCDLKLEDEGVSRRHCSIERREGVVRLKDLGSANGTFVNEDRVETAALRAGDRVRLGHTWLECREPAAARREGRPTLSWTGDGSTGETVVRRRIDPQRLEWLTAPPAQPDLDVLRRAQRHLTAVQQVSELLAGARDVETLQDAIVATIAEVTSADRAVLILRPQEGEGDALDLAAAKVAPGVAAESELAVSRTVVGDVLEHGISTLSRDAARDERYREGESVIRQRIRSVMCVPVRTMETILGALYVDHRSAAGAFDEADLELLAAIGNQAGIALHRARLLTDLERLFLDTIRAIAATIDAKDGYTHRHSERVAAFAVRIAQELGLPEEQRRVTELSALLHDLGKIGVPEAILNKPGKLTAEEFEAMRTHPVHGARILAKIQNPQFAALLPGVRHHHERWDGSGYPDGLRGEGIPLLGRVLGVADFLDALTSSRSYRGALSIEETIALLRGGAGTHFDPEVVEAALALHARGELALPKDPEPAAAAAPPGAE
jgi:HD-GYP domain-containing protein (c-di-GMP phosphodiesterase class II)